MNNRSISEAALRRVKKRKKLAKQEAKKSQAKEAARTRQIEGLQRKRQYDKDTWESSQARTSLRAKKRRSPLQGNSSNRAKLKNGMLPQPLIDSLELGELPAPPFWGSLGKPHVVGPFCERGGRMLQVDGRKIGGNKGQPRPIRNFRHSRPLQNHRSIAWDFATSLRGPRVPRLDVADCLVACSSGYGQKAGAIELSVYRASSRTTEAQERAERYAPNALHLFGSGQGPGVCSFAHILLPALAARSAGYKVVMKVVGESDRFLRTGMFLASTILRNAGIVVDCELVDEPYFAGQIKKERDNEKLANRLEQLLEGYIRDLFVYEETPELFIPFGLMKLPGLPETSAVGAAQDWLMRHEAFDLVADRHAVSHFRNHASWRRTRGQGGYWLMEAGYRSRMRLPTFLKPILPEGFEHEALEIMRLRFPNASFLEPIALPVCGRSSAISESNARLLSEIKGKQLVAIDHGTIHWGGALDLDVMIRQNGSGLRTVFPSSFAAPEASLNVIARYEDILVEARREERRLVLYRSEGKS